MDTEFGKTADRLLGQVAKESSVLREFLEEGKTAKTEKGGEPPFPPDKPTSLPSERKKPSRRGITRSQLIVGASGALATLATARTIGNELRKRQSNDREDANDLEFEVVQHGEVGGVQYNLLRDPAFRLVPFFQRESALEYYNLQSVGVKQVELVTMPRPNVEPYKGLWMDALKGQGSKYEGYYAVLEGRHESYPRTLGKFDTFIRKVGDRLLIYTLAYSQRETGTTILQQPLTGSLSEDQMAALNLTFATQLDRALTDFVGKQRGTTNPDFQPIIADKVPPALVLRRP